jgi:hypothetical protein
VGYFESWCPSKERKPSVIFRTSSYSGGDNGSQCVAVARTTRASALRDSKSPATGTLTGAPTLLGDLVGAIRAGQLTRI